MTRQWYRIHPAFGLRRRTLAVPAPCLTDRELGSKWEGLSDDDKGRRETAFYSHILSYLAETYRPRFEVELPYSWERDKFLQHSDMPRRTRSRPEDSVFRGTLTLKSAEVLAGLNPVMVTLGVDDELLFTLGDGWPSATIALRPVEPVRLRRELERLSLICG